MSILTLNEEIILSAIWMLGGQTHGALIRDKVIKISGKEIVYGTLYNSIEFLIRKGFVTSQKGEPTPVRGGRSKTIYIITDEGKTALEKTKALHESIWQSIPALSMDAK